MNWTEPLNRVCLVSRNLNVKIQQETEKSTPHSLLMAFWGVLKVGTDRKYTIKLGSWKRWIFVWVSEIHRTRSFCQKENRTFFAKESPKREHFFNSSKNRTQRPIAICEKKFLQLPLLILELHSIVAWAFFPKFYEASTNSFKSFFFIKFLEASYKLTRVTMERIPNMWTVLQIFKKK